MLPVTWCILKVSVLWKALTKAVDRPQNERTGSLEMETVFLNLRTSPGRFDPYVY